MNDRDQAGQDPMSGTETPNMTGSTEPAQPNDRRSADVERPLRQLDSIIDNLASYAAPVLRDIAARAAELAAKAGEAAGPMAQKAADKTEEVAGRVAAKSREVASDLRRESSVAGSTDGTAPFPPAPQSPAEQEAGLPPK